MLLQLSDKFDNKIPQHTICGMDVQLKQNLLEGIIEGHEWFFHHYLALVQHDDPYTSRIVKEIHLEQDTENQPDGYPTLKAIIRDKTKGGTCTPPELKLKYEADENGIFVPTSKNRLRPYALGNHVDVKKAWDKIEQDALTLSDQNLKYATRDAKASRNCYTSIKTLLARAGLVYAPTCQETDMPYQYIATDLGDYLPPACKQN